MYEKLIWIHNANRWVVLLSGMVVVLHAWKGLRLRQSFAEKDLTPGLVFTTALNIQVLIGIFLYARSPLVSPAFHSLSYAASSLSLAFFVLFHPLLMVTAATLAQTVYSTVKRRDIDIERWSWSAYGYSGAMVIILLSIPWPLVSYGRPLMRAWN